MSGRSDAEIDAVVERIVGGRWWHFEGYQEAREEISYDAAMERVTLGFAMGPHPMTTVATLTVEEFREWLRARPEHRIFDA